MTTDEWLKDQCNRYSNGACHNTACIKRGGYTQENKDTKTVEEWYSQATCHANEALKELEQLRNEKD